MDQQAELCETYQLKWNYYNSYMHSCIATSLYNESYADVALVTMDGHQVMAHRYVLSYSSRYLSQVLKYQRKVTTALPLMIVMPPEIDYKSLKVLLRYMYSGEAKVPKEILKEVLRGGDLLQIKGLYREKEDDKTEKHIQQTIQIPSPIHHTARTTPATTPTPVVPSPPPLISCSAPQSVLKSSTPKVSIKIKGVAKNTNSTDSVLSTSGAKAPITPTFVLLQKPQDVQGFGNATSSGPTVINFTLLPTSGKEDKLKTKTSDESVDGGDGKSTVKTETSNNLQYLMIKDEPVDWSDVDMKVIECQEVFEEIQVKSEQEDNTECTTDDDKLFSPLTCELCTETFSIPKEWVRHVQTHTDMLPAKRRRRDSTGGSDSYGDETFPELTCDLCQKPFTTPAEWVKHIESAHTEFELHVSNRQNAKNYSRESPRESPKETKTETEKDKFGVNYCKLCNKSFPSNASMLIHKRSHTGEKPFTCEFCCKTFNVKSNLLRHLRTIHNKIVNTTEHDVKDDKGE